jgi:hypothetical protein
MSGAVATMMMVVVMGAERGFGEETERIESI